MKGFSHSGFLKKRLNDNEVGHWASTLLVSQMPLRKDCSICSETHLAGASEKELEVLREG